jgi:glycosyltransferase involved in cell wall biosynthesis
VRALLLTQYYPPEPASAAQKTSELAQYLASHGHQVTVVTGFPNYPDGVLHKGYRRRLYQVEWAGGVKVVRTFLLTARKRHAFGPRMKNHLSFMVSSIYGGLRSGRPGVVYVYSPPLFLGVSGYVISRLFKAPLVVDVHDLWPKAPIPLGILKNPTLIRLAEALERFVYSRADHIFFYSHRMRRDVVDSGVPEDKTEVHPLWVDTDFFKPVPDHQARRLREEYGFGDKLVVMYTGNISLAQGLDTAIEGARLLRDEGHRHVLFVLVGGGADRDRLAGLSESHSLDNVLFIPPQPVTAMPAFMSAADVLLTHLNKAPFRLGTIPSKLLAYMSAERPVLAGLEGEAAELVLRTQCGVVVEPENPRSMADAILRLQDSGLRRRMGEAGRRAAVEQFERKRLLAALEGRFQEIVAGWKGRAAPARAQ